MTADLDAPAVEAPAVEPQLLIDAPGRYDIPEDAYHADPMRHRGGSLSSTVARMLLPPSVPALARYAADHPDFKDCYDLGTVTHRITLGSGPRIVEVPADSWQTKAAKDAREKARADGAVALLTKDLARAHAMRDAVHNHPLAHALLTLPGAPEQTLIWRDGTGDDAVWCRAMLDRWPDPDTSGAGPIVVDVKKTGKALTDDALAKTVWEYGYHVQAEWYSRGYSAVHGVWPAFVFLFVMDRPPHLVRCVELGEDWRADAYARTEHALTIWRGCRKNDDWPGYPTEITTLSPPRWADVREDF